MNGKNHGGFYLWVKSAWLGMHALSLPLAAVYLKSRGDIPAVIIVMGAVFLLLWLIAQALLSMYRFPLEPGPALRLTAGMATQALLVGFGSGSLTLAAYAAFYTSLAAVVICALFMLLHLIRPWKKHPSAWIIPAAALAAAGSLLFVLGRPLVPEIWEMESLVMASTLSTMALQILSSVRGLYGLSIFAKPHPREAEFRREWEKWAAPTIIALILAVAAAAITAGIPTAHPAKDQLGFNIDSSGVLQKSDDDKTKNTIVGFGGLGSGGLYRRGSGQTGGGDVRHRVFQDPEAGGTERLLYPAGRLRTLDGAGRLPDLSIRKYALRILSEGKSRHGRLDYLLL